MAGINSYKENKMPRISAQIPEKKNLRPVDWEPEKHMGNNRSITIRAVSGKDFDDIFSLLKQLWPDKELNRDALLTVFSQGIESQNDEFFCAEFEGSVIGFCAIYIRNSFWQEGRLGYIGELIVDEPFRGQGIGTALLDMAAGKAREKGCRKIELDSAFNRKDAHEFYEKVGFERRAYLFSRGL